MYLPSRFKQENEKEILALLEAYPFATVISVGDDGAPFVSHLPLIVEKKDERLILVGHLAKANPHWKLLDGRDVTAIFHGPQAYITPTWYPEDNVPTWNYAVVHMRGRVTLRTTEEEIIEDVKGLSSKMETGTTEWKFWIPDNLKNRLATSIAGFHIDVADIQAKFKLSQHRGIEERENVIAGLKDRGEPSGIALAEMMQATLEN